MTTMRLRLAKQGDARFIGHLDLMRAIERAVRRAGLPVALTEGFHPHYRISYGPALPLGATSTAEYADVGLKGDCPGTEFVLRLNDQLAGGLSAIDGRVVDPHPSLGDFLCRAQYSLTLKHIGTEAAELIGAWQRILESQEFIIDKETQKGHKRVDIRPGIIRSLCQPGQGETVMQLLLVTGPVGNLRPEDAVSPCLSDAVRLAVIQRDGLFGLKDGLLTDPYGERPSGWPAE